MLSLLKKSLFALPLFITTVSADTYTIDPDHSTVAFKVRHMAISTVVGRFGDFSGSLVYNPENVSTSKTESTINVESINTDRPKRDDHLRSPDFFDAKKFGQIKFVSTSVTPIDDKKFTVKGNLTIRDVTKPVSLEVSFQGTAKDPWGNDRAGFFGTTTINRKDFGLAWSKVLEAGAMVVGDEIAIEIQVEGIKKA